MSKETDHEMSRAELIRGMRQRTIIMEREGEYWTEDERKQLRELFKRNNDLTDIALALRRTEMAVVQQIQSLGLFEKARRRKVKATVCPCEKCKARNGGCPMGQK